jgi:hypothetical protein
MARRMSVIASRGASMQTDSRSGSCTKPRRHAPTARAGRRAALPPLPSTTPMPPVTLCSSLLPPPKPVRRHGRAVILQADPARDHHRRGHDQLQHAKALASCASRSVQEGAALQRLARRCGPRGAAMKALQPASAHSGRTSAQSRRAAGDVALAVGPRQPRRRPLGPRATLPAASSATRAPAPDRRRDGRGQADRPGRRA